MKFKPSDLGFILKQIRFGTSPDNPSDPLTTEGVRNVNGTFNNLLNTAVTDQHGNPVNTASFGVANQPFVFMADKVFRNGPAADDQTPFGPGPVFGDNYAQSLNVLDATPRIISNLVVDANSAPPAATGNAGDPANAVAPFNSLFTTFGQFVDHGLDFIDKGGDGVIMIPILPGDPLYVPGGMNLMPVTRASVDASGNIINSTAPFVDQNQTYGSDQATRFFLMEYDASGDATGRLVTGADGGMATWADVKANALRKGITLVDADVGNIPSVIDNGDGTFSRGPGTGQMFLADIAHDAAPGGKVADTDAAFGLTNADASSTAGYYDNELLDAHFIAGDGRTNENIALSAIHEVFHSEHNRLVAQIEEMIVQQELLTPGYAAEWTGTMIFEAAKLGNEMQYQHIVFEFFARRMSPNIDAFQQYNPELNPNITAEFSQAVFRLGHSMLTDTVDMVNAAGQGDSVTLIEAFLNPLQFNQFGAADINQGMSRQEGNEIDEFIVDAVRNFLVGLPLDLAAINIARGRDVGLGSLNDVRANLHAQTGLASLEAYDSWTDFGANLLHPSSLVNFIAAYAQDGAIAAARNANDLTLARNLAATAMTNADFMGTAGDLGFNDIDLWLGGLAEQKVPGGMLGATFDFIFASQFIALQNADRFYYLSRLAGTNILEQIEGQTFTDLIQQATGAIHMNGDTFGTADTYLELSTLGQSNFTKSAAEAALVVHEVVGGTNGANVMQGGAGNDTLWGEGSNDNLSGGLGNDFVFGGVGNDTINGNDGDDFLRGDAGNDTINGGAGFDLLHGGAGNDTMNGGNGVDELVGGDGNDVLAGGNDNDELIGSDGNDVLLGDAGDDVLEGGEGDDLLIGGAGADLLEGGGGYDIVSYETSAIGLTINMNGGGTGDAGGDTYLGIEEVRGTTRADTITGDGLDNVLSGLGGADSINGGNGNDVLIGGNGNDTLIGGDGLDTAVFRGARANYTVTAATVTDNSGFFGGGNDGADTINGIEFLRFSDQIVSVATGETVPLISLSNTTALQIGPNGGTNSGPVLGHVVNTMLVNDNTVLTANGITVANILVADPDPGADVHNLSLTGDDAASFQIVGGELRFIGGGDGSRTNYEAQAVYHVTVNVNDGVGGSAINYTLNITDVNDNRATIISGKTVNVQENTADNVVVYRVAGADLDTVGPTLTYSLVTGVGGEDNADFNIVNGEVRFRNAPNFEAPADANGDNIYNILVGVSDGIGAPTTQAVTIHVTNVSGPAINDSAAGTTLTGTSEEETILGNGGNDIINGLGGNDIIYGGADNDTINGGAGADTITGGSGNDRMNGGNGNDTFVFAAGFGNDILDGFDANPSGGGQDRLDISAFGLSAADVGNTNASAVWVQAQGGNTLVTIQGNTITLTGVSGFGSNGISQPDFLF